MAASGGLDSVGDFTEVTLPFDSNGDPLEQIVNKIARKSSPNRGASVFQAAPQSVRGIPLQGPTQSSTSIRPEGVDVADLTRAVASSAELVRLALDRASSRQSVGRCNLPIASTVNCTSMGNWGANLVGNVSGSLG